MFVENAKTGQRSMMNWLLRTVKPVQLLMLTISAVTMSVTSQAQTANTGAITGTVLDQSGAALPNADIAVISESNESLRKVTTDASGVYRVSLLPPGAYRIKATHAGFNASVRSGVSVIVTEIATLNLQLSVGTNTETVNVNA